MKNIHIVDANVILRYLLADHPEYHEIAKSFLIKVREGSCTAFFPESVIAECVYVIYDQCVAKRTDLCPRSPSVTLQEQTPSPLREFNSPLAGPVSASESVRKLRSD